LSLELSSSPAQSSLKKKKVDRPSPPRSDGPSHINGPEWIGPLDSWATRIEPSLISSGLHGSMGQPDPYFKMYYFVFFFQKNRCNEQ